MAQVLDPGLPSAANSPNWLLPTIEKLSELLSLGPNWDSYGARSIDANRVLEALRLLGRVMLNDSPPPCVVPTNCGGVQLEWHIAGVDLEIDIISSADIHVSFESSNESWERTLSTDLSSLTKVMERLSQRH
jgi:hypothetical protein